MARRRVTRKWEVFAGRNRFWCDGRLMTAPSPGVFALTLALVASTSALHLAFDGPFLARRVSPLLPCGGAALAALTLAALLRTALSDPGILPRAAPAEAALALEPASGAQRPPPRAREVLVRGRVVKLKYCFTCKLFRPPRASHCSLCDNCVERFDHHCPWVGNCVGRCNYRSFYTFVVSLSFLCVWVFACAVAHVAAGQRGRRRRLLPVRVVRARPGGLPHVPGLHGPDHQRGHQAKQNYRKGRQCVVSRGDHRVYDCPVFRQLSVDERWARVTGLQLCATSTCVRRAESMSRVGGN